jgi:hypothetical protein
VGQSSSKAAGEARQRTQLCRCAARVGFLENRSFTSPLPAHRIRYNYAMQKKVFWMTFTVLGLVADLALPFWWALGATIPVGMLAWWIAYRSDWF